MKTRLLLLLILSATHYSCWAQFYTVGETPTVYKTKNPSELLDSVPKDSIVSANMPDSEEESREEKPHSENLVALPLKSIRVSSGYGMRVHPITHKYCMHSGLDLHATTEPVYSMFPGKVVSVNQDNRSGKYVTVRSGDFMVSYCHLSCQAVHVGDYLEAGSPLGIAGQTGWATGIHLHLGIKHNGQRINPMPILKYVQSHL